MNLFTHIFLTCLATSLILQWILAQRHIKHIINHREQLPVDFTDKIPLKAHQKAADYTQAKTKTGLFESVIGSILLLLWTIAGGLQLLDEFWRSFDMTEILTGTGFILSLFLIMSIFDIPMAIYRTFKLEQSFGFNKTTPTIFTLDLFKNTIIAIFIGIPLTIFVLWLMENSGSYWWIYIWITWLIFSLLMMWAYPAFIAPLFNKFRPLENGALKTRIEHLLKQNGFENQGIFIMDGSVRSTHGNAYFTGLGKKKRIVFFDTLMNELSHDEIEAVLAHELGHFKCNHIKKRIIILGIVFLIGFSILGWLIDKPWFYSGLGIEQQSTYIALALFMIASPVFTFFLQPLFSFISRQHEFEADNFAAKQAHSKSLIKALVNLYRENANTLTPDPLYSAFYDSHPPAPIRIAHLKSK